MIRIGFLQPFGLCCNSLEITSVVTKFSAAARTLNLFGISERAGAAIVSAAFQDVGIISKSNVSNVVDRNKIRLERTKGRTTLSSQSVIKDYDHDQFGLYFDGRKDRTLSMEDNRRKVIIEEHDKAPISTVAHNSVIQLITRCHDDYISIKKTLNCKTTVRKTEDKFTSFIEQTSKLFDIAFCKCADFSGCTCPKDKNVPVLECQFLCDQRGPRIGRIGSVDLPVTKVMIKRSERSCKRFRHDISLSESSYSNAVSHSLSNHGQYFGDGDDVAGVENKTQDNFVKDDMFTKSRGKTYKPKLDLTETVIIAQRYNVSERAVAYITSAVLHVALKAVIISSGQSSDITSALIVDKNKIRSGKLKVARNLKQRSTDDYPIKSLYFEG
ncbi:hypothetical protein AVEN_80260-1 [Araneus ventricosus]|uniref:Uncharacterized protein n=1 Tax=Araneus ventricosus TaxID=182803 RepID=A0A4Y2VEV5_ARAVE|nr:hypothetical protein AVEN_80260-1 [Araneus ventricosus]